MNHEAPFFILANPRSGSSLLRIVCDCNKDLTVPPESGFLVWWKPKYRTVTTREWTQPEMIEQFVTDVLSSKKIETWHLAKKELSSYILEHRPRNFAEAASLVYYFQAKQRDKDPLLWGDKNNYYIHHLEELLAIYPKARFVHLIRDGRDVACSYRNLRQLDSSSAYFPNLPFDIEAISSEWSENNNTILTFLEQLPAAQYTTVHYEDMILSLAETCIFLCAFLGVPFDSQMLNYAALNQKNKLEPDETMDWKRKTLSNPDAAKINQYKKQLLKDELELFMVGAGDTLKKFGYE